MNIALIGMMGSGKTTVSEILTTKLSGFTLVDTDSLIVQSENMSINDIFTQKGEEYFRVIESVILEKVLSSENKVISTGGGIVKNSKNIEILKEKSIVFYLKADENELFQRVKNNKERPLLNVLDMKEKIHTLLSERVSLYEQAHYSIDTTGKTPDIIADEIIGKLA